MPTARSLLAALTLGLTAISCSDKGPTEANNLGDQQAPTAPQAKQRLIFGERDANEVVNIITPAGATIQRTVASVQVTKLEYIGGKLLVTGALLDASGNIIDTFTRDEATLTSDGSPTAPTCRILELDLGAIHLDLLGLVVDLAPVHLDIVAQSGPGNLLGNLLCALVNLLNGVGSGGGLLAALTSLLAQINALLAQLPL